MKSHFPSDKQSAKISIDLLIGSEPILYGPYTCLFIFVLKIDLSLNLRNQRCDKISKPRGDTFETSSNIQSSKGFETIKEGGIVLSRTTLFQFFNPNFLRERYRKRYSRGLRILGQVMFFIVYLLRKNFFLDFITIKEGSHNSSSVPNSSGGHLWVFCLLYGPRYV